jgi:uncharacterized protein (TIGR02118 family)
MTAHLIVMYPQPRDPRTFDRAYREEHLPYAGPRLKGATTIVSKRVAGPAPYYAMSDIQFPSIEALQQSASSSDSRARWRSRAQQDCCASTWRAVGASCLQLCGKLVKVIVCVKVPVRKVTLADVTWAASGWMVT